MTRNFILTLVALAAASPAAAARDGRAPFRATIETADLDLATAEGRQALLARISKAADRVCGPEGGATFDGGEKLRTCRNLFILAARARLSATSGTGSVH
jgi:UrcA family protein